MLRVLLVGEDPLAREGLRHLLSGQGDLVVVGQSAGDDLPPVPEADLVLWDSGRGAIPEAIRELTIPVVLLLPEDARPDEALSAGVRGVLPRDVDAARLGSALRAAGEGLFVLDEAFGSALARPRTRLIEELTPREKEVLELLAQGLSNRKIALRLGISDHTAKFHVNAILGKLGAETRTEAVVQAARLGLVLL